MSVSVEDAEREWTERRLVVHSVRHAESAQAALRARVAKAKAQVEALNQRGRGRKRYADKCLCKIKFMGSLPCLRPGLSLSTVSHYALSTVVFIS
jgi:hypothetical protein